ncbi:MAG: hypothetical protein ACYCO3_10175 [Mycobacteriales bacterium]
MGRFDQLDVLHARLREAGVPEPTADDDRYGAVTGDPGVRKMNSYAYRRKQMLLALFSERGDELDRAAETLGGFFDHLRAVGLRGYVAEKSGDPEFLPPAPGERGSGTENRE